MSKFRILFPYETYRVVRIPSLCLAITYRLIILTVFLYLAVYVMGISKSYQRTSSVQSTVVSKVKGVIKTDFTDFEIGLPLPHLYRRIWDASDLILPALDDSGGFTVITNIVITPNQTRGVCPESPSIENAVCTTSNDCRKGEVLLVGNGPMTGQCVWHPVEQIRTCEIESWCPVEDSRLPLYGRRALFTGTEDFTVLVKNSMAFKDFSSKYKRRNIMSDATPEYLQSCIHNSISDPYCPTFRIGEIIEKSGFDYSQVALTGGVFSLIIRWDCSFDGSSIEDCKPKYEFMRADNPDSFVSPGLNFRMATYHEENRRTLTRNYGLKILINVVGQGRKFDLILTVMATVICDLLLYIFVRLKSIKSLNWTWLEGFHEEMKYDLSNLPSNKKNGRELQQLNDSG